MLSRLQASAKLNACSKSGLQAIKGSERKTFKAKDPRKILTSIDIDLCYQSMYPNANRWDYLVMVNGQPAGYFVEVHPASTSEIATMIAKKQWLQREVIQKEFNGVSASNYKIQWLQTSTGCHILKTSKQYRQLVIENLAPVKQCDLGV